MSSLGINAESGALIGGFVTVSCIFINVALNRRRLMRDDAQKYGEVELKEINCKWLNQEQFNVLTQIIDAFIPKLSASDIGDDILIFAYESIDKNSKEVMGQELSQDQKSYLRRGALEMKINAVMAVVLDKLLTNDEKFQLKAMLSLLGISMSNYLLTGYPAPFQSLPLHERARTLVRFRDSIIPPFRVFYQVCFEFLNFKTIDHHDRTFDQRQLSQTLRRLSGNLFFSFVDHGVPNPNWRALGYNPSETVNKAKHAQSTKGACGGEGGGASCDSGHCDADAADQRRDRMLREKLEYPSVYAELTAQQRAMMGVEKTSNKGKSGHPPSFGPDFDVLKADVVIVGSGCGGGVMAQELVRAGLDVIILEKGGYFRSSDFKQWRESEAFYHSFEKGGTCGTVDGGIMVLAGSCVGGGSTVNWSASFRTPDAVRDDWAAQGLHQFAKGTDFEESLAYVHKSINVNKANSYCEKEEEGENSFVVNENNRILWRGATAIGLKPEKIPRNVKNCVDCGHCTHGCVYEAKQSTTTAMLEPLLLPLGAVDEQHQQQGCGSDQCGSTETKEGSGSAAAPSSKAAPTGRLHIIALCHAERVQYEEAEDKQQATVQEECEEYSYLYSAASGPISPARRPPPPHKKKATGVWATVKVFETPLAERNTKDRLAELLDGQAFHYRKIRVDAKIVVCSAGSLHTPALLLRSQLNGLHPNGQVGQYLTLHPVMGCAGTFIGTNTGLGSGVSMGVVVPVKVPATPQEVEAGAAIGQIPKHSHHAYALETPPLHLGLTAALLPWGGVTAEAKKHMFGTFFNRDGPEATRVAGLVPGLAYKLAMLGWQNMASFLAIPRDHCYTHNRVTIDRDGNPVLHYAVSKEDEKLLMDALELNIRAMRAGGASMILAAHESLAWHNTTPTAEGDDDEPARFEAYLKRVRAEGIALGKMQIFSAHQMSSCRMAASPEEGPTSPTGELYECSNVFVADGSALPSSLGINPMVTIEALSHWISKRVIAKLSKEHPDLRKKIIKATDKNAW